MSHWNEFAATLAANQNRLYGYTLSLLGDPVQAEDVLQRANVVLCEKADAFTPGTEFMAWACTVVRFEVMAYRKELSRDRLVFDSETLGLLENEAAGYAARIDEVALHLHECIAHLNERQALILRKRYFSSDSVASIGQALGMTQNAVDQSLFRIRASLARCIRGKLGEGEK